MAGPVTRSVSRPYRRGALVAAVLALGSVLACGDGGATDGYIGSLEGHEITVAIEEEYVPFHYVDPESGERTGWDHDVVTEICRRLGCTPRFEVFEWAPMIQAVADGRFDMAATGIAIRAERALLVDYSDPYFSNDLRIMARHGEDRFEGGSDLTAGDFLVGAQSATTNQQSAVDLVGDERVVGFAGTQEAVDALIAGQVDAVVINETAGVGYVRDYPGQIRLIGAPLGADELGMIFTKGSDLVAPFNVALASMEADGFLDGLRERYFPELTAERAS